MNRFFRPGMSVFPFSFRALFRTGGAGGGAPEDPLMEAS
jgi:hypothetical protein